MKKLISLIVLFVFGLNVNAQDLPSNPEPGKCYVRCKTPDIWKNVDETVETHSAYKKIVTHPAEYKTVTERVLVKEASKKLVLVPAVYETKDVVVVVKEASYKLEIVPGSFNTETVDYVAKTDANKLKAVPATFKEDSEIIETKPKSAMWQMSDKAPDCESSNPDDCRYWCYVSVPPQSVVVPKTLLDVNAHTVKSPVPGFDKSYKKVVVTKEPTTRKIEIPEVTKIVKKTVMTTSPTTKVIDIPAEYATIKKTVLVKDAWEEEVEVPAKYRTVTKEALETKGGLTTWKEVDCELLDYNILPINWDLNSATLTSEAKRIIDSKLLPVLKDGVKIELVSHTDSRGTKPFNQDLSDRRAQSVVNYLMSKGVNSSQLVPKGYGETKLINRCSDGVSCSEKEHRDNRRTTFRVINQ